MTGRAAELRRLATELREHEDVDEQAEELFEELRREVERVTASG